MKIILISILILICSGTFYGQQYEEESSEESFFDDTELAEKAPKENDPYDELVERLFNGTPPPINVTFQTGKYDRFIFDPYDEKMSDTYRALLKLYYHHLLNETTHFSDVGLEEELFWKMFKMTAAFMKYQLHLHENDTLLPGQVNHTQFNSTEMDSDALLNDMLKYYEGLASKYNESRITENLRNVPKSLVSRIKNKITLCWHRGINRFGSWWTGVKIRSFYFKQSVKNVTQTGVKVIKSLFSKVYKFFKNIPPGMISSRFV